jgi:nucleoside diphosphate kinase
MASAKGENDRMATLRQLFQQRQAGFTVYSPDCTQSRLWGNLDHAIHSATGFHSGHRQWINHDINSIMRFYTKADEATPQEQDLEEAVKKYDNIPAENLQPGHLVVKLFLSGPSLLTVWHGDNVIETLATLKGLTHPAEASPDSIRGRFWCDNAVCNLMHVSDDHDEAERELNAVKLSHLLDEEATQTRLFDAIPAPPSYIAHSGVSIVCDLVNRMLITIGDTEYAAVTLPPSGDARETNQKLTTHIRDAARKMPESPIAQFIDSYLAGDVVAVTQLMKSMPLTKWERFVVQSGALTRDKWAI